MNYEIEKLRHFLDGEIQGVKMNLQKLKTEYEHKERNEKYCLEYLEFVRDEVCGILQYGEGDIIEFDWKPLTSE